MMSDIATLVPGPADTELAASALPELGAALGSDRPVRLRLDGRAGDLEVPRPALAALAQVLDSFALGESVTVVPAHAELTTQQAADALKVSRPFLIGLLDTAQIEYRMVGAHRRVKAASLIRYLREDDARRQQAADALAAETRELGFA
jgi:excisionase family DNA binding protein